MFAYAIIALFAACAAQLTAPSSPTKVYVSISTNKIGSIKEVEGQYGFDFYFYFAYREFSVRRRGHAPCPNFNPESPQQQAMTTSPTDRTLKPRLRTVSNPFFPIPNS